MNTPAHLKIDTLPVLIDRATAALESARTSAEVLEARDLARVAYDAAKSVARRGHLTAEEREWNVDKLRKASLAFMEHADALEADGHPRDDQSAA